MGFGFRRARDAASASAVVSELAGGQTKQLTVLRKRRRATLTKTQDDPSRVDWDRKLLCQSLCSVV